MNTGETRNCRNDPTPSAFAMRPGLLRDARLRRVRRTTPFGVFDKWGEMYFFLFLTIHPGSLRDAWL